MAQTAEFDNRYVSVVKESTFGTAVTVHATASNAGHPRTTDADDESFTHQSDIMQRADMSRPVSSKSVTGKEYSEGSVNGVLQADDWAGTLLSGIFPVNSYSGGSNLFHNFTVGVGGSAYPFFTVRVGREDFEHIYTGQSINRVSFSAAVGEYVTYSADFLGKAETAPVAIDDGATVLGTTDALIFSTRDGLHFADGTVFLGQAVGGTATAKIKSINLDVNLNRDIDNSYAIGSNTCVRQPPSQMTEVSGSIEFNQVIHTAAGSTNEKTYTNLIAADGVEVNPSTDTPAMAIKFAGEDASAAYMKLEIFKIRYSAPTSNVSGRDTQTMSVDFTAMADNAHLGAWGLAQLKGQTKVIAF